MTIPLKVANNTKVFHGKISSALINSTVLYFQTLLFFLKTKPNVNWTKWVHLCVWSASAEVPVVHISQGHFAKRSTGEGHSSPWANESKFQEQ